MISALTRPLPAASDVAVLAARLVLGVVLVVHGWQKAVQNGFGATADGFAGMGIPFPEAAAGFAIATELGGGAMLVVGFLTRLVGLAVAGVMGGAFWYAHRGTEVLSSEGGWELVALIGVLGLVLSAYGAGRLSVDGVLGRSARSTPVEARESQTSESASDSASALR